MLRVVAGMAVAIVAMVVMIVALGPEIAALAMLALLLAALVVFRPIVGISLLVLLLPFNALVTQAVGGGVATAYGAAKDGILALLLLNALLTKRTRLVPRPVVALVALVVILPLLGMLLAPSLQQALFGWRNDYEPLLLVVAVAAVVDRRHIRPVMLLIGVTAQISAFVAVLTWNRGLEWLFDIGRLPVEVGESFPTSLFSQGSISPRAFSPYAAPNELAAAMLITLAVIWCTPALRAHTRLLMSALPVAAILLSESRSGLLGALVLLAVLAARALRRQSPVLSSGFLVLAGLGVAVGGFLYIFESLTSGSDSSFGGHADSLVDGLRQLVGHPLGMGLGTVGPRALQFEVSYHIESFWLLLALESGPLVLVLFLSLLVVLAKRAVQSTTSAGFVIAAALAATVVSQIVLPTLQEGPVSFLLWLVAGVSLAAQRSEQDPWTDDQTQSGVGHEPADTRLRR